MTTMERQNQTNVTIYSDRIIADPRVCGGQPIVKGTRIPVEIVLEELALSPDLSELFADYPRLTVEDVKACLEFARALVEKARTHPASSAETVHRPL